MDFFDNDNSSNNSRQPEIRNGVLLRVYDENIKNGVFVIPDEVTAIGNDAFYNCKTIKKVIFNDKVKKIDKFAFVNCTTLKEVVGLDKCTSLKEIHGFGGCTSLERIDLPDSIEIIAQDTFKDCENLSTIILSSNCQAISTSAFENCKSLIYLDIPKRVGLIHNNAFKNCTKLTVAFNDKKEKPSIKIGEDGFPEVDEITGEYKMQEPKTDYQFNFSLGGITKPLGFGFDYVVVLKNAFEGVQTVTSHNIKTITKVIDSGFKGIVTYFDDENEQTISMDIALIEKEENNNKSEKEQNDNGEAGKEKE